MNREKAKGNGASPMITDRLRAQPAEGKSSGDRSDGELELVVRVAQRPSFDVDLAHPKKVRAVAQAGSRPTRSMPPP